MSEGDPRSSTGPGWFERISHAFGSEPRDLEELIEMLHEAAAREIIDEETRRMIFGVLDVARLQVRDVMIPRAQMVVVEHDAELRTLLPIVVESGHSRFPVAGESRDEIVGLLLAKDLLRHIAQNGMEGFKIGDYLRPAPHIPESKRLGVLLSEFRADRNHLAIVADEYGGVAGLITIEDVLEQIVGDIDDEFDVEDEEPIVTHDDRHYSVNALLPIEDFNERFGTAFSDEEFDTIGGLVVHALGHLPRPGERVRIGDFAFRVSRADRRRVHWLEVMRADDAANPSSPTPGPA